MHEATNCTGGRGLHEPSSAVAQKHPNKVPLYVLVGVTLFTIAVTWANDMPTRGSTSNETLMKKRLKSTGREDGSPIRTTKRAPAAE